MNDIIWRAIKRAQVPAVKEQISLTLEDNKRPDSMQMAPLCFRGLKGNHWLGICHSPRHLCRVTHRWHSVHSRGGSSSSSTTQDCQVFQLLASTHMFYPIATETAGTWNDMAIELVQEIGRRTTFITQDTRETVFLFQRLSIALQRGNVVSFLNTMNTE